MAEVKLLGNPPPYKAWLTISSDPDFSNQEIQNELNQYIWEELKLPICDSLFIQSFNQNLPGQLNLVDHPEYFKHHLYNTIHTWGDFTHARTRGFDREDAVKGVEILQQHGIKPTVWTDHSHFSGNIFHNSTAPSRFTVDASNHKHQNFSYTLDLAVKAGVRYVWDGTITNYVGQNTKPSRLEWYTRKFNSPLKGLLVSVLDSVFKKIATRFGLSVFDYSQECNSQISTYKFDEETELYTFKRYGEWKYADINGLGEILTERFLNELMHSGGTSIVYTHLGKTNAAIHTGKDHIPEKTKNSLTLLKKYFDGGKINLSPLGELLDYLTIKNHIKIKNNSVNFMSDNIRFKTLSPDELKRFSFGVETASPDTLKVTLNGDPIPFNLSTHKGNQHTLSVG